MVKNNHLFFGGIYRRHMAFCLRQKMMLEVLIGLWDLWTQCSLINNNNKYNTNFIWCFSEPGALPECSFTTWNKKSEIVEWVVFYLKVKMIKMSFSGVLKRGLYRSLKVFQSKSLGVMAKKALSPIRKEEDGQRRHGCCNMVMAE